MKGEEIGVTTTYSNYKQNADRFLFPYSTTTIQGTTTLDARTLVSPILSLLSNRNVELLTPI
jgi:hypothetical protein